MILTNPRLFIKMNYMVCDLSHCKETFLSRGGGISKFYIDITSVDLNKNHTH